MVKKGRGLDLCAYLYRLNLRGRGGGAGLLHDKSEKKNSR